MRTHPVDKSVLEQHCYTTCQQDGNKQCEHILLTSQCWSSIATDKSAASLLQIVRFYAHILLTDSDGFGPTRIEPSHGQCCSET